MLDEPAPLPEVPTETMPPAAAEGFPPPNIRQRLSPDLMVLLTKVLAGTVVNLAGAP